MGEEHRPSSLPSAPLGLMGLRPENTDLVTDITGKEAVVEAGEVKSEDAANCLDSSLPVSMAGKPRLIVSKSATLPTTSLSAAIDNVWAEGGLGLGGLVDRMNKSTDVLTDKWLGAWET